MREANLDVKQTKYAVCDASVYRIKNSAGPMEPGLSAK